ncbi:MAG: T9SS type A sorting domain-containing protein [Bacteroidales bacterium]|nr:T9SS type A sorting domain-containing protein [Bacteroidales bacterium]
MKKILLFHAMWYALFAFAQTYQIGHRQVTYTDPSRNGRSIQTEIYYPANTAGDNVPVASGQFPLLIFGHGFLMSWDSYKNLWDSLVPIGYIMAFPRTEGGISPNHQQFGLDLRFLNEKIKSEGNNPSSFLYGRVASTSAIMGHSMGGGCTFIAGQNYTNVTTIVNFAAAETSNPSSIDIAPDVTVPVLMLCGEKDGVTPPSQHQIPMYNACGSDCKFLVTIMGGGHCYFANYNFNCSFGESTTSPQPTISREEQQKRVMYILKPYLNYMLKNNQSQRTIFFSRLQNTTYYNYTFQCDTTTPTASNHYEETTFIDVYPNPTQNLCTIILNENVDDAIYSIKNIQGNQIQHGRLTSNQVDFSHLEQGFYILDIITPRKTYQVRVIKQ